MSGTRADMKGHGMPVLVSSFISFSCLFILFFLFAIWSSTIGPTNFLFRNLENISYKNRKKKLTEQSKKERDREITMEMKRGFRVEKKDVEEENMCTALLTAFVVLSMACLKHFSSVSYLIEQWRSLVFLLLNVVLLAVYFTSIRPISGETCDFKTRRRGSKMRMVRGKKTKKIKKTRTEEPACYEQEFLVVEPKEVIKNCVVEETKRVCPEFEETVKDCLLHKKSVDSHEEEDEFEPARLSNEELNERVEAFITTFRQHLVLDARRGIVRETEQKMRSKDSDISFLGREVTCSV